MLKVLSQAEVCTALGGIDPSTLWSWYTSGHFPAPIELGIPGGIRTKIGWREDEVDAWIESRPRCGEPPVEMVPKDIADANVQDVAEGGRYALYCVAYGTEEQREDTLKLFELGPYQKP
jgi:predicted DNA-binding transcriptional regulator AlpA